MPILTYLNSTGQTPYCRLRYRHDYTRVAKADVSVRVRVFELSMVCLFSAFVSAPQPPSKLLTV